MAEFRSYIAEHKMRLAGTSIHFRPSYVTSDEKEIEFIENTRAFKRGAIRLEASSLEGDEVLKPKANCSRDHLEGLPRAELMSLAKKFGVKTFGVKSVDIIDELVALNEE